MDALTLAGCYKALYLIEKYRGTDSLLIWDILPHLPNSIMIDAYSRENIPDWDTVTTSVELWEQTLLKWIEKSYGNIAPQRIS